MMFNFRTVFPQAQKAVRKPNFGRDKFIYKNTGEIREDM